MTTPTSPCPGHIWRTVTTPLGVTLEKCIECGVTRWPPAERQAEMQESARLNKP